MADLHSLPKDWWPASAIRNNGPDHLVLERAKLRELAEGWPCYRDACEWENFESLFHPGAYVFTTWSGRVSYSDFIEASKAGMDKGAYIMHRCHGITTDINLEGTRAVTKMKAEITQRFVIGDDQVEIDVECDCRFCFFFEKIDGRWGACFVRHWYEKDRMIPTDPARYPAIDRVRLATYPAGYKHLAYFQECTMGVSVLQDMPGHRRHTGSVNLEKHDLLYRQAKDWVEGREVDI